jgi:polysaccharide export outer membrane protein
MNPGTIFLAQRFVMRDKDVLYVGNAAANQPTKLIQLVSQMFSPIVAVESVLVNTGTVP